MKNVQGVVFDWGGVIIDEPGMDLQRYCSNRLELDMADGSAAILKFLPLYQEHKVNEKEMWQKVCEACGQSMEVIPIGSLWGEALRSVFRFRQEVVDAIHQLRLNGYKTGFLSNTEPEAAAFFYELKMDDWFHGAVLSCEVGMSKPQPEIYHIMGDKMQLPLNRLLFLDDRQENIDGAHVLGMQAVRVATTEEVLDVLDTF